MEQLPKYAITAGQWVGYLQTLKNQAPSTWAIVRRTRGITLEDGTLTIKNNGASIHAHLIEQPRNIKNIKRAAAEYFEMPVTEIQIIENRRQ